MWFIRRAGRPKPIWNWGVTNDIRADPRGYICVWVRDAGIWRMAHVGLNEWTHIMTYVSALDTPHGHVLKGDFMVICPSIGILPTKTLGSLSVGVCETQPKMKMN